MTHVSVAQRLHPSFLVLLLLLILQYLLFLCTPWPTGVGGDELYYVHHSTSLVNVGSFPKIGRYDFRPPGYPVVLAIFGITERNQAALRPIYGGVQFVLVAFVLSGLHAAGVAVFRRTPRRAANWILPYAVAIVLGIQPWTFAWMKQLTPDILSMVITTAGIAILAAFIVARRHCITMVTLPLAALLLLATFMLRPEMLLFATMLLGAAIVMKRTSFWKSLLFVAIAIGVVGAGVATNVYYRWQCAGRLEIFGELPPGWPGYRDWINTWNSSERVLFNLYWGRLHGEDSVEIPAHAYANAYEERQIAEIIAQVNAGAVYDQEMDQTFASLAAGRIQSNWPRYWLLPRVWRMFHLWGNLETNSQLLQSLAHVPRSLRHIVLGALLVLKGSLFLLAFFACVPLVRHFVADDTQWYDHLALLMLILIASRTFLIGFVYCNCEHRYMLVAWPAMLWLAIYGSCHLCACSRRLRSC